MEARHFFVEVFGQDMNLVGVLALPGPKLDLGKHLVGKTGRHDKARMTGGVAKIQQPSLRQQNDPLA